MSEKKDQLKEILKDQLNREAKQIEEEVGLNDNEEIPNELKIRMKNALDQKIREREMRSEDMKRTDAYAKLSEEDQEALRLGRELQKRRKEKEEEKSRAKRRHHRKRITAAAAVLVLVIGIGTTGVGGPKRIVEMVGQAVGGRQVSKVNSSKKSAKTIENDDEAKIYQQIKDQLGFDSVRVIRFDESMKYLYGEIDEEMQTAQLLYKYDGANISYIISGTYSDGSMGTDLEDTILNEYTLNIDQSLAQIVEYELPESKKKEYSATFEYQGVYYRLIGTIEKADFEEILKNLHFPS